MSWLRWALLALVVGALLVVLVSGAGARVVTAITGATLGNANTFAYQSENDHGGSAAGNASVSIAVGELTRVRS